jgi:uncharacterized membrane protein YdbT with pleckstrin-like domain
MNYKEIWDKTLANNETIEYEFSISKIYRFFNLIIFSLAAAILAIPVLMYEIKLGSIFLVAELLAIIFIFGFYLKIANAYALTNKRVLIHRGWLSTDTISINYERICNVGVVDPFFERILMNSGDLHIDSAAAPHQEIILKHIDSPYQVAKKLEEIRAKFEPIKNSDGI